MLRKFLWSGIAAVVLISCSEPKPPADIYTPVSYTDIEGWSTQVVDTLAVFTTNCKRFKTTETPLHNNENYGTHSWWRQFCEELKNTPVEQQQAVFEQRLQPMRIEAESSFFTGYYTPQLEGSRTKSALYNVPLRGKPKDHITLNLKDFGLEPQTIIGKVHGQRLIPYDTRAGIEQEAEVEVLLWLKNDIDKFFLQIQGSGVVQLDDGTLTTVGYLTNNGHRYVPIGRVLRDQGHLAPDNISMQSIRDWLQNNPQQRQLIFNSNPRYIFFRELAAPQGAAGYALTPNISLAIDPKFHPYGLPVWVNSTRTQDSSTWQQLMLTHDTGSAIKGAVRGDIYFGHTQQAELYAGHQQSPGQFIVFWPKL